MSVFRILFLSLALICTAHADGQNPQASEAVVGKPIPKYFDVVSSEPRISLFANLTDKEKELLYHMDEAGKIAHDILFLQRHRHGLLIKDFFEQAFSEKNIPTTKAYLGDAFEEFLAFGLYILDAGGVYDAKSNLKYYLQKVTAGQISYLLFTYLPERLSKEDHEALMKLFTDPSYEPRERLEENPDLYGGNLYTKGIRESEVKAAIEAGTLFPNLNTRVIRKEDGTLTTEVHTVQSPGPVGTALQKIRDHLRQAENFATTEKQKTQLKLLADYLESGDVEQFRQSSIAWIQDAAHSRIDVTMGWVEVYQDTFAKIGNWESVIVLADADASQKAQLLATSAQYFEDKMPFGPYKKIFPPGYAPAAQFGYYFIDRTDIHSSGFNLPNFDDLRRDYGFKNFIKLPMSKGAALEKQKEIHREALAEFLPAELVNAATENFEAAHKVLVLLHEIIGHGSGTYDREKYPNDEDPVATLGSLASSLEEQRADLTGLVFLNDPKLVEAGFFKNQAEADTMAKSYYDGYLAEVLIRISTLRSTSGAHDRGHLLFLNYMLDKGGAKWVSRNPGEPISDQNRVPVITDLAKFKALCVDLLAELQRIKATRDEGGLKAIYEKYAPADTIQQPWAQAVIQRGENLRIRAFNFTQPWRIVRGADGKLTLETLGGDTLESIAPFFGPSSDSTHCQGNLTKVKEFVVKKLTGTHQE